MSIKLISLAMAKNFMEIADKIGITEQSETDFIVEEIVTGDTSDATAIVHNIFDDYLELIPISGTFLAEETITGGLSGTTATTTYVTGRFDALLGMMIEQVSGRIETYLNRQLKLEERTEYFDGGDAEYSLPAYPVDIEEDFGVTIDGEEQDIDEDFYLYENEGIIEFVSGTGSTRKGIEVTYSGGYEEDETDGILAVPDDLKRACLFQTVFDFRRRNDLGLSSVSMPDGSVSVYQPAKFLPEVEAILKIHRRIPI